MRNRNKIAPAPAYKRSASYIFSHHAGILLHSFFITQLPGVISFAKQWLISILLGALNIEQSKLLNFYSLENMFCKLKRSLNLQRHLLGEYCLISNNMINLLRYNSTIVKERDCGDFYYDPHTKPYRGIQKILRGWCGNLGRPEKIINIDFIHTCNGEPVWLSHDDNFYDLRERFLNNLNSFRQALDIPDNRKLTIVVDRGIYKLELFKEIIESHQYKLITWEKGYKRGKWDDNKKDGEFIMPKYRNNSKDILFFKFEYIIKDWLIDNNMKQLIVKATNPKGNTIEVSILTNDKSRADQEVIKLMFNRWLQENDFKYLSKHFGIDEITSYDTISYKSLEGVIDDKQVKSGELKSLNKDKRKLENQLKKVLLSEHQSKRRSKKRKDKIKNLTFKLSEMKKKTKEISTEESKLDALIRDGIKKLKTNKKALMDVVKIIARNIFYKSIESFKNLYNNYRDDHVIYRNLTQADGCINYGEYIVEVILFPTVQYAPKTRDIIDEYLLQVNNLQPIMPDGSNRKILFSLAKNEENKIVI